MRKILLAEDDVLLRETYQMILATQPYACDFVENGKEALDKCREKEYDLILLDIMMPIMSGIEFLENIQDHDEIKAKVILMSNLSSGKELEKARELGVTSHIIKSDTSPSQLISRIRYQLDT